MLLSWKQDKDVAKLLKRLEKENNLDYEAVNRIDYGNYRQIAGYICLFGFVPLMIWFRDPTLFWYFAGIFLIMFFASCLQAIKTTVKYVLLINDGMRTEGTITKSEKWTGRYFTFYGWLYWCEFLTKDQQKIQSFHRMDQRRGENIHKNKMIDVSYVMDNICQNSTIEVFYLAENPEINTLAFPQIIKQYNLKKVR